MVYQHLRYALYRVGERIEELILIFLILANIFDFFEILPGDLDYVKKIVSWTALGYLLYKASLTDIFFSERRRGADLLLILAYFSLLFKDFILYAKSAVDEAGADLSTFYSFIIQHDLLLTRWSIYLGGAILVVLSVWFTWRATIRDPSVMATIHEEGPPPRTVMKWIERWFLTFFLLVTFFVVVFNLLMEWLAIAVDAPLVIVGIFFFIFKAKAFSPESFVYRVGTFSEEFLDRFIRLFHTKDKILLGISGMLVLHLVTDVGNFLVPYIVGFHDVLYFEHLGAGHESLLFHMAADFAAVPFGAEKVSVLWGYILNLIGMLMLLCLPSVLWYRLFSDRGLSFSPAALSMFFMSVVSSLLLPAFGIRMIGSPNLVGVDIVTQSIVGTAQPLVRTLSLSLAIGAATFLLAQNRFLHRMYNLLGIAGILGFFGYYIFLYFGDIFLYYAGTVESFFGTNLALIGAYLFIFFTVTILFYAGGFFVFVWEILKGGHHPARPAESPQ
ncbi:hypothetical protein JXB02_05815 [Candidatus Woesearchaeota archaeon]|nr:hypothetical protein [Candidatus Woesearchaeota archaeon]